MVIVVVSVDDEEFGEEANSTVRGRRNNSDSNSLLQYVNVIKPIDNKTFSVVHSNGRSEEDDMAFVEVVVGGGVVVTDAGPSSQ